MIKIMKYGQVPAAEIFDRGADASSVADTVSEIIADVEKNGDEALYRYCEQFDGAALTSLEVSEEEWAQAMEAADPALIEVMKRFRRQHQGFSSETGEKQLYHQRSERRRHGTKGRTPRPWSASMCPAAQPPIRHRC